MNIVFLDIDGVLNNMGSVVGLGNPSKFFDPVSVALVGKLCREGNARIVVSSSWRCGNPTALEKQLSEAGAESLCHLIIGETPEIRMPGKRRGDEIALWLSGLAGATTGKVDRYVILDDDSDMYSEQPFVKTTFEDGFRFKHYIAALRHLAPTHPDCNDRSVIVPAS